MIREASAQREKQEQSIKARKNELFVEEEVEQSGPRKRLRDYVKETPAAPLSKNVKLMLWGSAAPVVFLFVATLLARRPHFKAPEEMVIPVRPSAPAYAIQSGGKPPAVGAPKAEGPGPGATANPSKPPQEKAKAKAKKKPTKKAKPKDETAVAQNTEGDSAKSENSKDGDQSDQANAEKPRGKSGDAKNKQKTDAKDKSATPPKKRAAPILIKKKRDYNPAYPPRTPAGEKKGDSDSDSDSAFP